MNNLIRSRSIALRTVLCSAWVAAACEYPAGPSSALREEGQREHIVNAIAALEPGTHRVWRVADGSAGPVLPLTSDHPGWSRDRLTGLGNLLNDILEARAEGGTTAGVLVFPTDGDDPDCILGSDPTDDEREEFADCVNTLVESGDCDDVLIEHWMGSGETHAHCVTRR